MSIEENVKAAINGCRERLDFVQHALNEETSKPVLRWQTDLLTFLYKEREVFAFALTQLESLLKE